MRRAREEEGQSATWTVRLCYGPFSPSSSSDQATGSRHPEGSFSSAARAAAAPHGSSLRRAGRWMEPATAESPRRPSPPVPPLQSAPRLASPPPAGGEAVRGARGGGGGVGPERGRQPAGGGGGGWEDVALGRSGEGSGPRTDGPGRSRPGEGGRRRGALDALLVLFAQLSRRRWWGGNVPSPPASGCASTCAPHALTSPRPPFRCPAGCPSAGAAAVPRPKGCGAGNTLPRPLRGCERAPSRAASRGAVLTRNITAPIPAAGWERKFAQNRGEGDECYAEMARLPGHPPACDCACLNCPPWKLVDLGVRCHILPKRFT